MVDGNELKLVIFADDMTSFVRDKQSHLALFNTIKLFSTYSGLCINHDKTEILLLGNMEMKSSDLGVKEISKVIKILGVHFTHNYLLFWKMNFETIEKSLRESLKGWSWRGLTLFGKIQVIKSFAIPKILYRASLISIKKDFIKRINKLLYSFIWKGKDKIKRTALINPYDEGGLKMPDVESMISAQRVLCIKKYLSSNPAGWKFFLDFYLKRVGGKFLFHCNFDYTKLPVDLPDFYKECLLVWTSQNEFNPSSLSEITNQVLWNNKFICIESRSVYNKKLLEAGLVKIGDLYDERGEFKLDKEPWRSSLSPVDHFFIFRLFNALPQDWRGQLKRNKIFIFANTQRQSPSEFYFRLEGKKHTLDNLHSKSLYQSFVTKLSSKPTAMKKYDKLFNTDTFRLDWEKIYLLPFKTTLYTKLREFQYKLLNRIIYTNDMLFKFRKTDSPLCYFCETEPETLEHFFFYCSKVRAFWEEVNLLSNSQGMICRSFDIRDILFGVLDIVSNEILLNYIVLESKHFIYRTKLNKTSLSLTLLIEKIRKTFQIERHIAKKNNKLQLHYNKWNPFLHLVEQ